MTHPNGFTKIKEGYTIYVSPNGYQAKVFDNGDETLIITPQLSEWAISDIPEHRKEDIQPLIEFMEKDLSHSFTPATDELE